MTKNYYLQPDSKLIIKVLSKDSKAFIVIFDRYYVLLFSYVVRRINSVEDTKELIFKVFSMQFIKSKWHNRYENVISFFFENLTVDILNHTANQPNEYRSNLETIYKLHLAQSAIITPELIKMEIDALPEKMRDDFVKMQTNAGNFFLNNLLSIFLILVLFVTACKKEVKTPYVEPVPDKIIKVEIDLYGQYEDYQLFINISQLTTHAGRDVYPRIILPENRFWTRPDSSMPNGVPASHTLVINPIDNKIVIESTAGAGEIAFRIYCTRLINIGDDTKQQLSAIVTVWSDGKIEERNRFNSDTVVDGAEYRSVGLFHHFTRVTKSAGN